MFLSIKGVGKSVPGRAVDNLEMEKLCDTNDEWIATRTGIKSRYFVTSETMNDLASEALENALDMADFYARELDFIILTTCTADNSIPSEACALKKRLSAEKAVAFDISAACSGFTYGLWLADCIMKAHSEADKIAVVSAEINSKIIDPSDRSTFVLFGDGAGAAVLQRTERPGILSSIAESFYDNTSSLSCIGSPVENIFNPHRPRSGPKLFMDGRHIFRFASSVIVDHVLKISERSGKSLSDIDFIVPHQANERIIDYAVSKLNVPADKFFSNIAEYGNTSSASIPIAMCDLNDTGRLKNGDTVILTGFGGGLTAASVCLVWNV